MSSPHGEVFDEDGNPTDVEIVHDFQQLLDDPIVVADDDGKESAQVLCGADYLPEATNRSKENIDVVTWMVLDVDNDDPKAGSVSGVPTEKDLREALEGFQAVVYASPSHKPPKCRWRVLLPLKTPLPPKKYRAFVQWLSQNLVAGFPGCIDARTTGDPGRLGFVGVTKHPEHYVWWQQEGELFDWTIVHLEEEGWNKVPLGGADRQPQWTDRTTGLIDARRAMSSRGYDEVKAGKHRREILWHAAKELWWDWAAEDENFVMDVLRSINEQFPEAKEEEHLVQKMNEAHSRVVGPNRIPQTKGPYGARREPGNAISTASIKHLARRLKRSHKAHVARVGDEMARVAAGDSIADDYNTWKSAINRVALALAAEFSWDRCERIADFFKPCLGAMIHSRGEKSVPPIEEIESWIRVKMEREKQNKIERRARDEDNVRKNISAATGGARDTPYSPEEWEAYQAPNGCGLTMKTVLLQCGRSTWTFLNGTYDGPFTEAEFDAQGYANLEAASAFVDIKKITDKGVTYIKLSELLQKYGSKCNPHVDFMCDRSWFRPEDRTLVVHGPVRNPLEPKFHSEVDEWLRKMTGRASPSNEKVRRVEAAATSVLDEYDTICNWLACVPQLDHICAALYLQGPKSVGKGLFATGVGNIWKKGAISAKAALDHFNSMLTESPFIHVNEGLPPGMSASVLLRRTLADTDHIVTRKGIDSGKVTGCVRMVFTANNLRILDEASSKEKLQGADIDALSDRFIHIKVRPEGAAYLLSLGPRHRDFYHKFYLAEHTLWMHEKRWEGVRNRNLRFLVEGQNTNVSDAVATNVESTSDVCAALVMALAAVKQEDFFSVQNGELLVNTPKLRRTVLLQNPAARYNEQDIVRAVESVTTGAKQVRVGGKKARMWGFKLSTLKLWCENNPLEAWEDVRAGLEKLNTNASEATT